MKRTLIALVLIPLLLLGAAFGLNSLARKNHQEKHVELMETLLPGGKDFELVPYDGEDANIRSVHKSSAGYIVETATHGYVDDIVMYVGVDNNGKVIGLVVYEAYETPGIGQRILTDHVFLSHFLNKTGNFAIGSAEEQESDGFSGATWDTAAPTDDTVYVDGISGATVSSKAVARCVTSAVAYVTGADAGSSATTWGG